MDSKKGIRDIFGHLSAHYPYYIFWILALAALSALAVVESGASGYSFVLEIQLPLAIYITYQLAKAHKYGYTDGFSLGIIHGLIYGIGKLVAIIVLLAAYKLWVNQAVGQVELSGGGECLYFINQMLNGIVGALIGVFIAHRKR